MLVARLLVGLRHRAGAVDRSDVSRALIAFHYVPFPPLRLRRTGLPSLPRLPYPSCGETGPPSAFAKAMASSRAITAPAARGDSPVSHRDPL